MKLYTLCYLEKNDKILMLYRNKKENDINKGKWIGVGGRIEENETPLESVKREVKEETGYILNSAKLIGMVNFVYNGEMDYIYVFKSKDFQGELLENCPEGELKYIEKSKILDLEIWEGDKYFLSEILNDKTDFFSFKLEYLNQKLIKCIKEI